MPPHSILILGAGELGMEVLRSLALHPARKATKLAVLRRPSSRQDRARQEQAYELRGLDVVEVTGNIEHDSLESLADVLTAYQVVINCSGMAMSPTTQLKVARAALRGKVRKYFPWQFGVYYDSIGCGSGQGLFDLQLDVRDLLRGQSEMEWLILSTGKFISFLFEPGFDVVSPDRRTVTALGGWDNRITVTAVEDIGKIVAEIALVHPELNGVVYAAGDTISMSQLADVVDETLGIRVLRRLKTVQQLQEELAADPQDGMRKYRLVFAKGVGVSWDKTSTINDKLGLSTTSVMEWAKNRL